MATFEASCLNISRLVLYGLHWLLSLCVFAITAAALIVKGSFFDVSITLCWWENVGMCRFVIGWGVVGWLGTSSLVAAFVVGALGIWALPLMAEMGIWIGWSVYWTVGGIASVVATRAFDDIEGYVVILLLWLLIPLSITSSILCCSARCCGRRKKTKVGEGGDAEIGYTAAADTLPAAATTLPAAATTLPAAANTLPVTAVNLPATTTTLPATAATLGPGWPMGAPVVNTPAAP